MFFASLEIGKESRNATSGARNWVCVELTTGDPAGTPGQDFYQDKIMRFVVGQAPGGGYDTYTRAIAHHIIKHIPGHPAVMVENMTGAGSLVPANYIATRSRPG